MNIHELFAHLVYNLILIAQKRGTWDDGEAEWEKLKRDADYCCLEFPLFLA